MKNKKGFTLIELLVVVLIIGILAVIALPQYRIAVLKAKITTGMPIIKAIYETEQVHFLTTGSYTDNFQDLDIKGADHCAGIRCVVNGNGYQLETGYIAFFANTTAAITHQELTLVKIFRDNGWGNNTRKGDVYCLSRDKADFIKVCQSLGGVLTNIEGANGKVYKL